MTSQRQKAKWPAIATSHAWPAMASGRQRRSPASPASSDSPTTSDRQQQRRQRPPARQTSASNRSQLVSESSASSAGKLELKRNSFLPFSHLPGFPGLALAWQGDAAAGKKEGPIGLKGGSGYWIGYGDLLLSPEERQQTVH